MNLSTESFQSKATRSSAVPNALKLQWESAADGGWSAELKLYEWRNRMRLFPGTKLFLWLYAARGIRAADLPRLALRDAEGNFTQPLELSTYTQDIKPGSWTRVGIPLAAFQTASVNPFQPHRVSTLIFVQGKADAAPHTLLLDDIRIENEAPSHQAAPPAPAHVQAKGYERHIDITWSPVEDPALAQYVIYRSVGGDPFRPIGVQRPGVNRFCDYTGDLTHDGFVSGECPDLIAARITSIGGRKRDHACDDRR